VNLGVRLKFLNIIANVLKSQPHTIRSTWKHFRVCFYAEWLAKQRLEGGYVVSAAVGHDAPVVLQRGWSSAVHRRTGRVTAASTTTESSAHQKSTSRPAVSTGHQDASHARRQRT